MTLTIPSEVLAQIHRHGEQDYPEEGAGFLLGREGIVEQILTFKNIREDQARHNRYLISAQDYVRAELTAENLGLVLIGVFHSHPDHPNHPSEFDREWAQPNFSYVITSINRGKAAGSRSWLLLEDRSNFKEQPMNILAGKE